MMLLDPQARLGPEHRLPDQPLPYAPWCAGSWNRLLRAALPCPGQARKAFSLIGAGPTPVPHTGCPVLYNSLGPAMRQEGHPCCLASAPRRTSYGSFLNKLVMKCWSCQPLSLFSQLPQIFPTVMNLVLKLKILFL